MTSSRTNRWAQWALSLALVLAGLALTFIVFRELLNDLRTGPGPVKEQREVSTSAWVVSTLLSEPGETREAFIWRVADHMQAWTDEHGAEVCGYLATDGERWGVKLTTQKSQAFCFFAQAAVPDGMKATPETIHSHPTAPNGWLAVNDNTRAAARAIRDYKLGSRGAHWMKVSPGFSPDDYNSGPGYLVANGLLLYQTGNGTEREISPRLPASADPH